MSNTVETLSAIRKTLSPGRISTYEQETGATQADDSRDVALYAWNAQMSAFLLTPLHICEVVVRNAAAEALEQVYGSRWPWVENFVRSLSTGAGYNPQNDLQKVARIHSSTGKVIPELTFAFWEALFTARHDSRLWSAHLTRIFPHHPPGETWFQLRSRINSDLREIRMLRNRIAHHEPIFTRNLPDDFSRIYDLVALRSPDVASWMVCNQNASRWIGQKPVFRGGRRWNPSQAEIAKRAYEIWERGGCQPNSEDMNWYLALEEMLG